jgi:hypothetical protein
MMARSQTDAGRHPAREAHQGNATGAVSSRDGSRGAVVRTGRTHRTGVPEAWKWPPVGLEHAASTAHSKLIQSVEVAAVNIHDNQVLPWLLHGEERRAWGDSTYAGQAAVLSHRRATTPELRATNRWKSRVRARAEHPFGVIKSVFGLTKVGYRGLARTGIGSWWPPRWRICS